MTELLSICACLVAVVAGIRSTWSPCGLSMLSTITPLAERGRGHRWSATASWYLVGALAGGATLGAAIGGLAGAAHRIGPSGTDAAILALGCVAALVTASSDVGLTTLPIHKRQVNERWLDTYRPSVYAAGFGWQIGAGVVTYIKTSAVYLLVVLAVLTQKPLLGLGLGLLFGLVRGVAVFASWRVTSPTALASFHRRFAELGRLSRAAVIVTEVAVVVALGWAASPWLGAAVGVVAVAMLLTTRRRHDDAAPATSPGGSRSARTA